MQKDFILFGNEFMEFTIEITVISERVANLSLRFNMFVSISKRFFEIEFIQRFW